MVSASSIIRISIVGDASGLTTALGEAEGKVAGIARKLGTAFVALKVGQAALDFGDEAILQADRFEDATTRIENQLGGLANQLKTGAESDFFLSLGLSPADVLEMEARFADLGTAIGISNEKLANTAPDVVATAAAFSLLTDKDPDTVLDLIAKAAGGSAKAAKELGIELDSTLSPSQQLTDIMLQMKPALDDVTTGTTDLEGSQRELAARVETLQQKLGGPLSEALNTVLGFILDEIDAIPGAIQGFELLGTAIHDMAADALAPLARLEDALQGLRNLLGEVGRNIGSVIFGSNEAQIVQQSQDWDRRNQGKP